MSPHSFNDVMFPPSGVAPCRTKPAVTIDIRVDVLRVSSVDQGKETFTATFIVELFYADPTLYDFEATVTYRDTDNDHGHAQVRGQIQQMWGYRGWNTMVVQSREKGPVALYPREVVHRSQPNWNSGRHIQPRWGIVNFVGEPVELLRERSLEFCRGGLGYVYEKLKMEASFVAKFDFRRMPFDRQLLHMMFISEVGGDEMQFSPLCEDASASTWPQEDSGMPNLLPAEWMVQEGPHGHAATLMVPAPGHPSAKRQAEFAVVMRIERRLDFFMCRTSSKFKAPFRSVGLLICHRQHLNEGHLGNP